MDSQLISRIQNLASAKKEVPDLRTGMQVEVSQRIKEGDKSRVQKFEGVIIRVSGKSHGEKSFTVRRVHAGLGIEKTFPIACPTIEGITVIRQYKVKRAHIGYVRNLEGKAARLKEVKAVKKETSVKKTKKAPAKKAKTEE